MRKSIRYVVIAKSILFSAVIIGLTLIWWIGGMIAAGLTAFFLSIILAISWVIATIVEPPRD